MYSYGKDRNLRPILYGNFDRIAKKVNLLVNRF